MFLLSKFFPKLLKPEKHRGYESETGHGGEKPKDYQCKVILLDDSELNFNFKSKFYHDYVVTEVILPHFRVRPFCVVVSSSPWNRRSRVRISEPELTRHSALQLATRMSRKNPCCNLFVWMHISSQTIVSSVV